MSDRLPRIVLYQDFPCSRCFSRSRIGIVHAFSLDLDLAIDLDLGNMMSYIISARLSIKFYSHFLVTRSKPTLRPTNA